MATFPFKVRATGSQNVYACLENESGQFFDFNDNTFKALGSATTPYVSMTEQTNGGGSGNSHYYAAFDLSLLPKRLTTKTYWATAYVRAGGSPAPLTDVTINDPTPFNVQAMELGSFPLSVECSGAFTTTSGTAVRFIVSVNRNGVYVPIDDLDASAAATITAREHGAGSDLFTTSSTTVNSSGWFSVSQSSPGYTTDREYQHTVAITVGGESMSFAVPFPVFG
jgi:hypothetical protein